MTDLSLGLRLCQSFHHQSTTAPPPPQPQPQPTQRSVLAYNSGQFRDYYPGHIFLNLAKQLRAWFDDDQYIPQPAFQDANGYYTSIPSSATRVQSVWAWGGLSDSVLRRYVMTYTGQGTISFNGMVGVVSRENLQNGERIVFDVTAKGNILFYINAIPDPANHPRDFVILPDELDWQSRYAAGEIFTTAFLDHLRPNGRPLAEYRHLNAMIVNDSTYQDWADYPGVDHAVYTGGIPIPVLCELAKQADHIPWFCIPAQASDDFVTQMAALVTQELPDLRDKIRVEFTNEHWNSTFHQNSMCLYKAAEEFGGVLRGTCTLVAGSSDVVLDDVSGLSIGHSICFFNSNTRRYIHNQVAAVNGTTVTLSWGHYQETSDVLCVTADFFGGSSWYAKRSCEVMALWENAAGVRPVRVIATQTANTIVTNNILNAPEWVRVDPNAGDVVATHDRLAVTTYFYAARDANQRATLLDLFRQGDDPNNADVANPITGAYLDDSAGRAWALNRLLNTEDIGLSQLEEWLKAQYAIAISKDLDLIVYEGISDHTIAGLSASADDTRLWKSYANFVFSPDFNAVWNKHFEIMRRYIDGPAMVYVDVAPASRYGLFGMHRYLGDVNARATHKLQIAHSLTQWWGDDVAPQATSVFTHTIARTTNQTADLNMRTWFTRNAAVFSAVNMPDGITLSADGVLSFAPTTTENEQTVGIITVQTATGMSADFGITFDLTYVPPIVLPAPSYETTFDALSESDITLHNGAYMLEGDLICEDASQQSHARLAAYDILAATVDPDSVTYAFTYRLPQDFDMPGFSSVIASTLFIVLENSLRINTTTGFKTITLPSSVVITDGMWHRLVFVANFATNTCSVWQDGLEIASLNAADFDAGQSISRLTTVSTRLGAPFSGVVQVRFGRFRAWLGQAFTPDEVFAIDD